PIGFTDPAGGAVHAATAVDPGWLATLKQRPQTLKDSSGNEILPNPDTLPAGCGDCTAFRDVAVEAIGAANAAFGKWTDYRQKIDADLTAYPQVLGTYYQNLSNLKQALQLLVAREVELLGTAAGSSTLVKLLTTLYGSAAQFGLAIEQGDFS